MAQTPTYEPTHAMKNNAAHMAADATRTLKEFIGSSSKLKKDDKRLKRHLREPHIEERTPTAEPAAMDLEWPEVDEEDMRKLAQQSVPRMLHQS